MLPAYCSITCMNWGVMKKQGGGHVVNFVRTKINNYLSFLPLFFLSLSHLLYLDLFLVLLFAPPPFPSLLNLLFLCLISPPSPLSTWLWPETTARSVCGATAGLRTPWTTVTTLCPAPFTPGKSSCAVSSDLSRMIYQHPHTYATYVNKCMYTHVTTA